MIDMERITQSRLRLFIAGLMMTMLAVPALNAKTVVHDGINYDCTGTKAKVKKYNTGSPYSGAIVIPKTFSEGGTTYTVVATNANAFLDCTELTSVTLPNSCVTIGRNCFKGCTALTQDPTPSTATSIGNGYLQGCSSITEVTVPTGVSGTFTAQNWEGMTSLKKITFADSNKPFKMNLLAFTTDVTTAPTTPVEEIYFGRNIDASTYANNQQPFHNMKWLKSVTFGGEATTVDGTMFQGCTALETVTFAEGNKIDSIGGSAFASCKSLKSIAIPAAVTQILPNTFQGCTALASATMSDQVTYIGEAAFMNTGLTRLAMPSALKTIGPGAFQNCPLSGNVNFGGAITSIGKQAFAGTQLTGIAIGPNVASIGNAAFAPITTLANITCDESNANFCVTDLGLLMSKDKTRLLVTAHQKPGMPTNLTVATITSIDAYGMAYSPIEYPKFENLENLGDYAFAHSKVREFTVKPSMRLGLNLFKGSGLETITVEEGIHEIPQGLCAGCPKLTEVNLPESATNMMKDCFAECPSLKSMEIPTNVNYMEPGSVPATIETLRVLNPTAPALAAGVFEASQGNVTCKVAPGSVASFKAASQWQYLHIVSDPTIPSAGANLGCPSGLYFATTDGKLKYKAEDGTVIDTEFETGAHAFTLESYKNRIYVADAGAKFTYQNASQPLGDGQLFYVNKSNDYFYRVTVLNNVGYNPAEDPFCMAIDSTSNTIYISDRNVGVHKLNADTTGLYGSQPFLFQNQYLPYYNDEISWGSITGGFTKDSKGIYWMTKKFNGIGLLRFTDADIYPDGGAGKTKHFNMIFRDVIIKTIYLDEKNGYLYMFVQKDPNGCKPGIYRIALNRIQNADGSDKADNNSLKIADCQLIDDAPVKLEGTPDSGEIANVAQINGDGTNVFWGYVAPATGAEAISGSVALDASNPMHKSGIKSIKSAETNPTVTFAVEGVEAYGVCGATYVAQGSTITMGDINNDGLINVSDVNALIDKIFNKNPNPFNEQAGDLNGDGKYDVSDVTALINIILGR